MCAQEKYGAAVAWSQECGNRIVGVTKCSLAAPPAETAVRELQPTYLVIPTRQGADHAADEMLCNERYLAIQASVVLIQAVKLFSG